MHYFEEGFCESILIDTVSEKKLQDYKKDSIEHYKNSFLKSASVYIWFLRKIRTLLIFVFLLVVYKKK